MPHNFPYNIFLIPTNEFTDYYNLKMKSFQRDLKKCIYYLLNN